ncbi:MAG: zinc metallopeptidase [Bacteroidales bacterium]|jgi:Zn-dependent membrane protease YugP|nr:zinc metallopeptidase [Bacteroidales bacterium]
MYEENAISQSILANSTAIYWIIFIAVAVLSWVISSMLNRKVKEYSKIPTSNGLSGKDVAEEFLRDQDIYDVSVVCVEGHLSDHYNPATKTVNLSKDVYYGTNVAAAAVAAHECGHAVQHNHQYAWLEMRSKLVPAVSFASKWVMWVLLAGMFLVNAFPQLLLAGIILFAMTTLFSFITLPVEINASRRALVWLEAHNVTSPASQPKAEHALRLAAYTYVIAALSSLATLLYYIMIYLGRRD